MARLAAKRFPLAGVGISAAYLLDAQGIRQIPDTWRSRVARWVCPCWIETEEFNNTVPVFVGRSVVVLFPFFDGRVADFKSKKIASCVMGSCMSTLFLQRCSPKVWGAVG
jgi:hypothetical protein